MNTVKSQQMKAILEFNLPDDQEDFDQAASAGRMHLAVWKFDQHLRSKIKYDESLTQEAHDAYQDARDQLYQIFNEYNLSID